MPQSRRPTITVRQAVWPDDCDNLRSIREDVFVREQSVPTDIEWDGLDAAAWHILVFVDATPIATGRLQPGGKIGRMAVRKDWRGQGLGSQVLRGLIDIAISKGLSEVYLHAQTHALDFYARQGFTAQGVLFEEAGIPHQAMYRQID
jgi:predicted GNAT family N-acyltransferase